MPRARGTSQKLKCVFSEEYYFGDVTGTFPGAVCSNDPHFYQMCDLNLGGKINDGKALCEHYFCELMLYGEISIVSSVFLSSISPNVSACEHDCFNTDLNKVGCQDRVALRSGQLARPGEICNDVCESQECEDEANCNGYTYGLYCEKDNKLTYIPPNWMCDGKSWCDDGADEANCSVTELTESYCRHYLTETEVPVQNSTRCLSWTNYETQNYLNYCIPEDLILYQTNCTDPTRVGVSCMVKGYKSTVSKYMLCFDDKISACDDKIDSICFKTTSCKVHKHLMCDKKEDCGDGADETHPICTSTTGETCERRVGKRGELSVPTSWIKDGVWDCENGADETADWKACGHGRTSRYVSSQMVECENVFVCRVGYPGFVELSHLCDGLETCGNENEICSVSSRSYSVTTSVLTTSKGLVKSLSHCIKGLHSSEQLGISCTAEQFIYPDGDVFGGTNTTLILPRDQQSCDHMYGELYVYTSCTDGCVSASCPLRTVPRYEVCPYQFPNRVGTIVNNEYLIFLTKSFGKFFTNRYFVCDNKLKCIDYTKVCDLIYDCEDGSDEAQCTNHFKCSSSKKLLPKTKMCDGLIDCSDLSDECNDQCSKTILEGIVLKVLSWSIGITAVIANVIIIRKSLRTLKRCKTVTAVMNRLLIIMISLGDFLIGCYLCVVAIYDTMLMKHEYCLKQTIWITSPQCSVIGLISTFGSQISLFSMTGLSIVRTYGIMNSMRVSGELSRTKIPGIAAAIISIISISTAIAVIPIIGSFEDFFVNGVKFSDELKIFIGPTGKQTLFAAIRAYYGRTKIVKVHWETLIDMTKAMFSHDFNYFDHSEKVAKVDFYGNSGVCLFKFFVLNEDPQKLFVWGILFLNFLCFTFISLSYFFIWIITHRSS